ncbi:hypothetical protein PS1_008563 [Malus domestica]
MTKLLKCELERLNKATNRHLHLVPACNMFESTFKNQASTALEEASSQIQNQASTALEEITRIQKILQPSSRSKLWKVNKAQKQIRADSSTTKAKDHLPHEASCGPISTFKIKPQRPLKKFQTKPNSRSSLKRPLKKSQAQFKIKPQRPLKKSPAQFKIKPRMALGSTSTIRDFKTHLLHTTSTCIQRVLKWGHL